MSSTIDQIYNSAFSKGYTAGVRKIAFAGGRVSEIVAAIKGHIAENPEAYIGGAAGALGGGAIGAAVGGKGKRVGRAILGAVLGGGAGAGVGYGISRLGGTPEETIDVGGTSAPAKTYEPLPVDFERSKKSLEGSGMATDKQMAAASADAQLGPNFGRSMLIKSDVTFDNEGNKWTNMAVPGRAHERTDPNGSLDLAVDVPMEKARARQSRIDSLKARKAPIGAAEEAAIEARNLAEYMRANTHQRHISKFVAFRDGNRPGWEKF